jgi:vanillate/3-O-methylgallate O-demethylase
MLRESSPRRFAFPYPDQHTNWQDEQQAWVRTATLFDQSHHMTDVYFKGPDVKRLLSDTGTNSFATFGRDKAKHFVACTEDGHIIGTAVLFGLEEDEVNLVGPAAAANWVQFQAETNGYDVEVIRDERTSDKGGQPRLTFRYEIEGPNTWDIVDKAHGGTVDRVKFFQMTEFTLGGVPVRALSHTMVGTPGAESMGLEIWGPVQEGPRALDALLAAGEEFGMVRGGALAYYTGSIESGYMAQPTAAVYTREHMKPYREWLDGDGYEGKLSIGGSFRSEDVEDYYMTPYDFGYGHLVRFDHDFIGRSALEEVARQPHRKKVWLRWNDEDVTRVYASSLFDGDKRAKYLETPLARYSRIQADGVYSGDQLVGVSTLCGYTVNVGSWFSVAMLDEEQARDGVEVAVLWGEENGGTAKRTVERHAQTSIRATVCTQCPSR